MGGMKRLLEEEMESCDPSKTTVWRLHRDVCVLSDKNALEMARRLDEPEPPKTYGDKYKSLFDRGRAIQNPQKV